MSEKMRLFQLQKSKIEGTVHRVFQGVYLRELWWVDGIEQWSDSQYLNSWPPRVASRTLRKFIGG